MPWLSNLAAGAAIFNGQQQGRQASDYQQQLFDLKKRLATAQTRQIVAMPDGTFKVVDLADPNIASSGGTIGTPENLQGELQTYLDSGVVPKNLVDLTQRAIRSGDRNLQGDVYSSLRAITKQKIGGGGKLNPMYATAMADNNLTDESQVTALMLAAAYRKIQAQNSSLIAARTPPTVVMVPGYDELGRPTASANIINRRAGTASPVMTSSPPSVGGSAPLATSGAVPLVGHKPTAAMSAQLNAVNEAENSIPGIEALYPTIVQKMADNGGAGWLLNQWRTYNKSWNPAGIFGSVDPDAANWFTKVGQLKGLLLSAAGANSRNLKMVNDLYGQHVVGETQDPVALMQRIRSFQDNGRFDAVRKSLGVSTESNVPLAGSPATPTDDLSSRGYVKLPDGTWYNPTTNKYDDGK